ncbi:MAG: dihydrolipoyl dehydrogenase [Proteobacteria bacterium]|nr:MAG: dihydrolipoyl dehydrogenase [Pseudomonadota bacterium]
MNVDLVVIGSGPGGYSAAFRAADLGLTVALVERDQTLGGVCLNVGCIPSKALLHAAKVISDVREMRDHGLAFGAPTVDLQKLIAWKSKIVGQMAGGLGALAKQRNVQVVTGVGAFASSTTLRVSSDGGATEIEFKDAIVAAGSEPFMLPGFPNDDPRLIDSTGALELKEIPARLLVVGGGIIGLEMATVYMELGARVTVVEMLEDLMAGVDRDLVKPLAKRLGRRLEALYTNTQVTHIDAQAEALVANFNGDGVPDSAPFDTILVAVGRQPNGAGVGLENAGVHVDERGFVPVDQHQRTNVANIYAIGDIVGEPMLAHKATHEGKVAAEVIAGHKVAFEAQVIPSVAYTDPEVAWVGLTETEAKAANIRYEKGVFPWAASGRSLTLGRNEGITKLLFDPDNGRIIGAGIVGPNAGDLISEAALAIEMGCDSVDISLTIHPHPTLSETIAMAAEVFNGTITDLYVPKKHKK